MRLKGFYAILIGSMFLWACNYSADKTKVAKTEVVVRGEAQGTTYTVKYIAEEYDGIKVQLDSLLHAIDLSMSTYIPNSTISMLNKGDTVMVDSMFLEVVELSKEISTLTNGAFDPTIGPLIKAWGFDYSDPEKMDSTKILRLLNASGFDKFQSEGNRFWKTDSLARINFNAVAQGYAVDLMAKVLDSKNLENYYVELGGELIVKGTNKYGDLWIIGIDSPNGKNLERVLSQRISLNNKAMVTSGNYRKFYEVDGEKYSHTINPVTGYPAKNKLLSATVVAEDAGSADALATALMVMGVEKAKVFLDENTAIGAHLIYSENGEFKTYTTEDVKKNVVND